MAEADCTEIWLGPGTSCDPNPCLGACCIGQNHDICVPLQTAVDCESAGGEWGGPGSECPCVGACCVGSDHQICVPGQMESDCPSVSGQWAGLFTTCPSNHADLCQICDDGDANGDGDVDLQDFAALQMCFEIPYTVGCKCVDMDNDIDVDLDDYAGFHQGLGGSGSP